MNDQLSTVFLAYRDHGDPADLAVVFDATAAKLLLLAAHLTRDDHLAEDLVQSTFLCAVEQAHRYDGERPLLPWLNGILVREARAELRRRRRRPDPERLHATPSVDPESAATTHELASEVAAAIDRMAPAHRMVLNLRWAHGLSNVEIAHALGIPAETVRSRVHRGLQALRKTLPSGLTAAVALLAGSRGLAAVRRELLARSAASGAGAAPAAGVGASAVLALALVGFATWWFWPAAPAAVPSRASALSTDAAIAVAATESENGAPPRRASPAASSQWTIRGVMRQANGRAARGEVVRATLHRGDLVTDVGHSDTAEDGSFAIDADVVRQLTPLQRGAAEIVVRSQREFGPDGEARSSGLPLQSDRPHDFLLNLELPPGCIVRGRVFERNGRPESQALVMLARLRRPPRAGLGGATAEEIVAHSDGSGRFALPITHNGSYRLLAGSFAGGFAVRELGPLEVGADIVVPELTLRSFATLAGQLTMADGTPAARIAFDVRAADERSLATISINPLPRRGHGELRPYRHVNAVTDDAGRFHIAALAPGDYLLRVRDVFRTASEFEVSARSGLRLTLPGQLLSTTVEDEMGRPLPGATLRYRAWRSDPSGVEPWPEADAEHTLVVADRAARTTLLLPGGARCALAPALRGAAPSERVWLADGTAASAELHLVLRRHGAGGRLRLDLRDDAGQSLAEFSLRLRHRRSLFAVAELGAADLLDGVTPELDAGEFLLSVCPGASGSAAPTHLMTELPVTIHSGRETAVAATLPRAGSLALDLVPPTGEAVERWQLLTATVDYSGRPELVVDEFCVRTGQGWFAQISPPAGKTLFGTQPLPPGRCEVTVRVAGYTAVTAPAVIAGGEVTRLTVALRKQPASGHRPPPRAVRPPDNVPQGSGPVTVRPRRRGR